MVIATSVSALIGVGGAVGGYVVGRLHACGRAWSERRRVKRKEGENALDDEVREMRRHGAKGVDVGLLEQYTNGAHIPEGNWNGSSAGAASPAAIWESVADMQMSSEVAAHLENALDWNFDSLRFAQLGEVGGRPLMVVGVHLLQHSAFGTVNEDMLQEIADTSFFGTRTPREPSAALRERVTSFLREIEGMYLDVPYHNNVHACDVMQTVNCFFEQDFYKVMMNERLAYRFTSLIAGAIHSVGHSGQTNTYHVATESDLAITYNDTMPLENMHAASAFRLMRNQQGTDWLSVFRTETPDPRTGKARSLRSRLRRNLISMVLATDNARHADRTQKFTEWVMSGRASQDVRSSHDHQLFALETALHAADISSSTKVPSIALPWASLMCEEFWAQGDLEKKHWGHVSLPMFDRSKVNMPASQMSYMQYVVKGLYTPLTMVMPEFRQHYDQINRNMRYWESRKAKGKLGVPPPEEYPPDR
eukprot:TRINITY_DN31335_c0_g1_i1.p1 TRINITY_DN31335_c0_g1~~TRINITY_DN31335_c0_g1_i1.p1  ORF type:complete len:477 (-),score=89.17 TRINITY_DN31335_c0_g1_i1:38-1468(-)